MAPVQAPNRMGKNYHPYEAAYISQINTIQRHVARDLGIPLIDYEVIMDQVRPSLRPPKPLSARLLMPKTDVASAVVSGRILHTSHGSLRKAPRQWTSPLFRSCPTFPHKRPLPGR